MAEESKLTDKQARFVEEYFVDSNATAAAKRAGYSKQSAEAIGWENLRKPLIAEAIERRRQQYYAEVGATREAAAKKMGYMVTGDIRDVMSPEGRLLFPSDWSDETAACISSIEVVTKQTSERDEDGRPIVEYIHKIKRFDTGAAVDRLAKLHGMYVDKQDIKVSGLSVTIAARDADCC